jgi:CheY-like chemotaxis protein
MIDAPSSDPPAPLNVLVVEDQRDTADTLAWLLRQDGHAVRIASDGGQAVRAALGDPPDVILLDIGLPVLDGWEVARCVRAGLPGRPPYIIATTGYGQPEDLRRSVEAGIQMHLCKPVDPDAIREVLRGHRA